MLMIDPEPWGKKLRSLLLNSQEKDVRKFCDLVLKLIVEIPQATNKPTGAALQANIAMLGGLKKNDAPKITPGNVLNANQGAGGTIAIYIAGEEHHDADDSARAQSLVGQINTLPSPEDNLIIEERDLFHTGIVQYKNFNHLKEYTLTTFSYYNKFGGYATDQGFSEKQRSAIVACFAMQAVAGGDQSRRNNVLFLFGANHRQDIVTACEHIADTCSFMPWLKMRPRTYTVLDSTA